MLPTFDFHNIVKRMVVIGCWALLNPITILGTFSLAVAGVFSSLVSLPDYLHIPNLSPSLNNLFLDDGGGLLPLIGYALALDHLVAIIDSLITFINYLVPFLITTMITFFIAVWVCRCSQTLQSAILRISR